MRITRRGVSASAILRSVHYTLLRYVRGVHPACGVLYTPFPGRSYASSRGSRDPYMGLSLFSCNCQVCSHPAIIVPSRCP